MPVKADFDAEVKIGGIAVPLTVAVVDNLSFDLILGYDFFRDAHAIVKVRTNTLSLFDGLTEVPMTATGEYSVVSTASLVTIPPLSEAVFPVVTAGQLAKGSYVIDGDLQLPCRSLLVARTLVDGTKDNLICRVLNPTAVPVKLKAGTPVGTIAAVHTEPISEPRCSTTGAQPSVADMRAALEAKGISFKDTALKGTDLEGLICLLYRNMDIMATSLAELPGTDVLRHRIDTGDSPPVRTLAYRHTPADKEEIS
jgi:hypothetical protein